jgi:XTP/dITP diphosphohydrolase
MKLYIATSNPGKLRDFVFASDGRIDIEPLPGLANIPAPPENSPYFEGNARGKASFYSLYAPGSFVLADDSGLEVEALDGDPSVRSARYADDLHFHAPPNITLDERNNLCLLHALQAIPEPRRARYRCVLAVTRADEHMPEELARLYKLHPNVDRAYKLKQTAVAHGIVEGQILTAPRGSGGFGYDPLFFLPDLNQTMAELDPVRRLSISHRGRALRNLLDALLPEIQAEQNQ